MLRDGVADLVDLLLTLGLYVWNSVTGDRGVREAVAGVTLLVLEPVMVGATVEARHILVTPVVLEARVGRLAVTLVARDVLALEVKRDAPFTGVDICLTAAPITSGSERSELLVAVIDLAVPVADLPVLLGLVDIVFCFSS